jgi:signal peptidase II
MTTDTAATGIPWRANLTRLIALVLAIVAADQVSKAVITDSLGLGQSMPLIPGLLHLTLVRNTGMAFGLLAGADIPFKAVLVTLLSVAAMGAVTYYALKSPQNERITRIGLTFILGGALGNIIDRVRLGYVVDFVDVFYGDTHWPAFNVADTCICIGVGLLLLDSIRKRDNESELADGAHDSGTVSAVESEGEA